MSEPTTETITESITEPLDLTPIFDQLRDELGIIEKPSDPDWPETQAAVDFASEEEASGA